jgi:hypothetical protein
MVDAEFELLSKDEAFKIWRIVEFKLDSWTEELYGQFYSGDAYLVYHAFRRSKNSSIYRDIYFWLGAECTQDESGTAAIKAVELDDYFGGVPVQHREVEGHESIKFINLFDKYGGLRYLDGGVASGFKVVDLSVKTELFHIKGNKNPALKQVRPIGSSLNQGDVFILSTQEKFFIFVGKKANIFEKIKGGRVLEKLRSRRPKIPVEWLERGETTPEFWSYLGGEVPISEEETSDEVHEISNIRKIYKYLGEKNFQKIAEGNEAKRDLLKEGIFIVQRGDDVVIWFPQGHPEKRNAVTIELDFLSFAGLDKSASLSTAVGKADSDELNMVFA